MSNTDVRNSGAKNTNDNYKKSKKIIRNSFIIGAIVIMTLVAAFTIFLNWLLLTTDLLDEIQITWIVGGVTIGVASIAVGAGLASIASNIYLKPINDILDGMSKLENGQYDTRLEYNGPDDILHIYRGFNSLAQELQGVEILRSDFVNSFSHEFKTPIMSINGLIGLMKNNDLSREKQLEYLNIIEEETNRLSLITTNILNVSRLENQGILTEKTNFNVSEQIRMSVLLLERRWTQKDLVLSMDFDEYFVSANYDLLKQVWINLLDNAIKFSDVGGTLSIAMEKTDDAISIKIGNNGPEIAEADRTKIFTKFYQSDPSHSLSGNGIGLSIVKKITELHGGTVSVGRENDMTVFTVTLPA